MIWLVLLFPLLGAVLNGLVFRKARPVVSHIIGICGVAAAFVVAVTIFADFIQQGGAPMVFQGFDWLRAGHFVAPLSLTIDRLSALMLLIVTGIGSLIHIYAGGYMHEEAATSRFFAYLNLFIFMMLLLVLGDNMLVMFVGWEGVGLCSYLLIGYWFSDDANAAAGMKAFLVNRIGDIGFLIGIFLTYKHFGTVNFAELRNLIGHSVLDAVRLGAVGWITLSLFIGATGKSAQIPLYIWLPDAMAGPTPVSALIHAATMVTAGIYMMARLNFMFYLSPSTMTVVSAVGAATALLAATIAIVQKDIKKVLAYSTVSQLGYMVMACGVGAFGAGVFHLLTHACFKALMFLGAGSVIVAMHHEQDMFKMGGLKKYMPITHGVFLIGVLAIIGFPGLSGFFSKDEILWRAYVGGGPLLWAVGAVAALCTAFYMVRLLCLTFYGPNRSDHHTREHLHETSAVMWAPLVVLAILSAGIGYLGVPTILGGSNLFEHYLEPVFVMPAQAEHYWSFMRAEHSHATEFGLMGISVVGMLVSAFMAVKLYGRGPAAETERARADWPKVYTTLANKYWVDEYYFARFVQPLKDMSMFLWKIVDVVIIDGIVNGVGQFMAFLGGFASFRMSGSVNRHAMMLIFGLVCLLTIFICK
jgi:NADH-quinone oxidoreductase subunit L